MGRCGAVRCSAATGHQLQLTVTVPDALGHYAGPTTAFLARTSSVGTRRSK